MTEICDCHDADKAYATINPNSPDRKEILSLNPPICKELNSNGLLINGTVFSGSKDIDESDPYTITGSESKLIWDSGEYLGSDVAYSLKEPYIKAAVTSRCASGNPVHTKWWYLLPSNQIGRWLKSSDSLSYSTHGEKRNCRFDFQHKLIVNGATFDPVRLRVHNDTSIGGGGDLGAYSGGSLRTRDWYSQSGSGVTEFAFYAGEITIEGQEFPLIDPASIQQIEGDGCILTINHVDGTTFNYGTVPCDSEITLIETISIFDTSGQLYSEENNGQEIKLQCGDRQCPPETCCNPCEGKALNCCYDENGKLIDSFIRRT